jgi:hypothetical protein
MLASSSQCSQLKKEKFLQPFSSAFSEKLLEKIYRLFGEKQEI